MSLNKYSKLLEKHCNSLGQELLADLRAQYCDAGDFDRAYDNMIETCISGFKGKSVLQPLTSQEEDRVSMLMSCVRDWERQENSPKHKKINIYAVLEERVLAVGNYTKSVIAMCKLCGVQLGDMKYMLSDLYWLYYLAFLDRLEEVLKYLTCKCAYRLLNKGVGPDIASQVASEQPTTKITEIENLPACFVPLLETYYLNNLHARRLEDSIRIKMIGFAILNIKRGCSPLTEQKVIENVTDYMKTLSATQHVDMEDADNKIMKAAIDDLINEIPSNCSDLASRTPSTSACYDVPINKGGVMKSVASNDVLHYPFEVPLIAVDVHTESFVKKYKDLHTIDMYMGVDDPEYPVDLSQSDADRERHWRMDAEPILEETGHFLYTDWVVVFSEFEATEKNEPLVVGEVWPSSSGQKGLVEEISTDWQFVETGYNLVYPLPCETYILPDEDTETIPEIRARYVPYNTPYYVTEGRVDKIHDMCDALSDVSVKARIVAILEPFKTRLITCGSGVHAHVLSLAQRWIFNAYRQLPYFHTVAGPPKWEDLYRAVQPTYSDSNLFMVSVDYKSATDYIKSDWTLYVWRKLCERLGMEYLYEAGCRSLTENILEYNGPGELDDTDTCLQKSGQLMGCIISFPILSILNAATVRYAEAKTLPKDPKVLGLSRHALFNGDDGLFPSTVDMYGNWLSGIAIIGFKRSPGKNYMSREFFTIDSTLYSIGPTFRCSGLPSYCYWNNQGDSMSILQLPMYNVGLCRGMSRVQTREQADESAVFEKFAQAYKSVPTCTLNGRTRTQTQELMLEIFLQEKSAVLPNGISWFAPKHIGGLGIPGRYSPTAQDLQVMYYLWHIDPISRSVWYSRLGMPREKCTYQKLAVDRYSRYPTLDLCSDGQMSSCYDWYTSPSGYVKPKRNAFSIWINNIHDLQKKARQYCHNRQIDKMLYPNSIFSLGISLQSVIDLEPPMLSLLHPHESVECDLQHRHDLYSCPRSKNLHDYDSSNESSDILSSLSDVDSLVESDLEENRCVNPENLESLA